MKTELNARVQAVVDGGWSPRVRKSAYRWRYTSTACLSSMSGQGIADEDTGRPVTGDTLFTSWSTTKGFGATCLHILADRGLVEYDTPVATYWPEFAVHGKDAVTVRHALTHMAGVPHMPAGGHPK